MSDLHLFVFPSDTPVKEVQALRRWLRLCGVRARDVLVLSGDVQHFKLPRSGMPEISPEDERDYEGKPLTVDTSDGRARERFEEAPQEADQRARLPETDPRDRQVQLDKHRVELSKLARSLDERSMELVQVITAHTGTVPEVTLLSGGLDPGSTKGGELHTVEVTYHYLDANGETQKRTITHERTELSHRPDQMVLHALRKAMQAANKDHCVSDAKG